MTSDARRTLTLGRGTGIEIEVSRASLAQIDRQTTPTGLLSARSFDQERMAHMSEKVRNLDGSDEQPRDVKMTARVSMYSPDPQHGVLLAAEDHFLATEREAAEFESSGKATRGHSAPAEKAAAAERPTKKK